MKTHACWNDIGIRGDGSCKELQKHVHCRNCPVYSAAANELLDLPVDDEYLANWTRHFRTEKETAKDGKASVVIFRIGAEWLALPVAVFREVCDIRPVHSLPHRRNKIVLGIANVRGALVVCVSLHMLFGINNPGTKASGRHLIHERLLVTDMNSDRLAFPVDEIHGIHRYHVDQLGEVPATVAKSTATYTRAILPWGEKAVGLLDDQLVSYSLTKSLA
jgi:chemotaxis-related protein WspD